MVIGFNPSHTNVNSGKKFLLFADVSAPLKMLSVLLRFLDNEVNGQASEKKKGKNKPASNLIEEWKMKRDFDKENDRLDTVGGDDEDYDAISDDHFKEEEKNMKIEVLFAL